jgi:hypothetical protein
MIFPKILFSFQIKKVITLHLNTEVLIILLLNYLLPHVSLKNIAK